MNAEHFRAFVWLRWRLFANRIRRGGAFNAALTIFFAGVALFLSAVMALVAFCVGLFVLRDVAPDVLLYVWDGLVVVFLFGWSVGVLVELQRSEPLSLEKFLHLPVSLTGAFFINYLSSLLTFSMVLFLPAMLALGVALIIGRGPALLAVPPLLVAFFLMVTAVTYQFQGWLASLMTNPRRRRTVIVLVTMAFILSCQLPNLANVLGLWKNWDQDSAPALARDEQEEQALKRALAAGEIDAQEYQRRYKDLLARSQEDAERPVRQIEQVFQTGNAVFPPGWLPLGTAAAAGGEFLPALLCFLGMTAIGSFSLWRAYRTTVRLYTGQFNRGGRRPRPRPSPRGGGSGGPGEGRRGAGGPARTPPAVAVRAGVGRGAGRLSVAPARPRRR